MQQSDSLADGLSGLVAGCALPAFGNTSASYCTDDDNNGLWTSLVAAAEFLRYGATQDPAARCSRWREFWHSADIPSPSRLIRLLKVEGGAAG